MPTLPRLDPPGEGNDGQRRVLVEFRTAVGWDQGLHLNGNDLARQAVVVHEILNTPNNTVRCWYKGRILVPLDSDADLALDNVPVTVRVVDYANDVSWVDLEFVGSDVHSLLIDDNTNDIEVGTQTETVSQTPCGTLHRGTYLLDRIAVLDPISHGYGGVGAPDVTSPVISWTVHGVAVPDGSSQLKLVVMGKNVTVDTRLDPFNRQLTLESHTTDGAYTRGGGRHGDRGRRDITDHRELLLRPSRQLYRTEAFGLGAAVVVHHQPVGAYCPPEST